MWYDRCIRNGRSVFVNTSVIGDMNDMCGVNDMDGGTPQLVWMEANPAVVEKIDILAQESLCVWLISFVRDA